MVDRYSQISLCTIVNPAVRDCMGARNRHADMDTYNASYLVDTKYSASNNYIAII